MRLFRHTLFIVCCTLVALVSALFAQRDSGGRISTPILGFSAQHAEAEHELENAFQLIPSPEKAREWHRTFTAEPHPAASERNNQLAEFIADEWRKQGWEDVTLRHYDVLHSRPRSVSLKMVAPVAYTAGLREDP